MSKICIVGDILVDITLKTPTTPLKMRLGGIVHAARCLWAMDIEYDVGYFAPSYLDSHIQGYLSKMGCKELFKLGEVQNCPYTMLIDEVKEVGNQGYEFILRDDININYNNAEFEKLNRYQDIFFISGNYNFKLIVQNISEKSKLHYDIANNIKNISDIKIDRKFETLFISTSSHIFQDYYKRERTSFSIDSFFYSFETLTKKIIFKENRGGSRAYNFDEKKTINIPSQTQKIVHSVGVGDVYDIAYVTLSHQYSFSNALNYASWVATEYAKTTFPDDFKIMVSRVTKIPINDIISLGGCSLPWEKRKDCHIYIAAPDFNFIDTKPIDLLEQSLMYHNFMPHRPIQENGQMSENAGWDEKQELFNKDMKLLGKCNMLIAVLLYNDPGTLIEIGLSAERKIPTIVYDPYNIAKNCMLTQIPDLISTDLDEIMSKVFLSYSKIIK